MIVLVKEEALRTQLQPFSVRFKNIILKLQDCAVSFKHWREVECQKCLIEISHKRTHKI
jgi:hypothetical protein